MGDQDAALTCGQVISREISMPQGCQGEDCHRRFELYFPTSVCVERTGSDPSQATTRNRILPLVLSVHCLGCSVATFHYFQEIAETYQFVWVNPEGLHHSFNAGDESCCGYALERGVDDKAFLRTIIQELTEQNTFVSKDWVYAWGWSNGGYMISAAADLFRAVAPIAGYQIEALPLKRPTALFLHHALDDPLVQATGCCIDSTMPQCCCQLSLHSDTCTSVESQVARWATNNACASVPIVSLSIPDDITCYTFDSCLANTTYCIHSHQGHFNRPSFPSAFSYSQHVADFFAHHMCITANPGASWDSSRRTCHCHSSPHSSNEPRSIYCSTDTSSSSTTTTTLDPKPGKDILISDRTWTSSRGQGGPLLSLVTMCLSICLGLSIWYLRSSQRMYPGSLSKRLGATKRPMDPTTTYMELAVRNM